MKKVKGITSIMVLIATAVLITAGFFYYSQNTSRSILKFGNGEKIKMANENKISSTNEKIFQDERAVEFVSPVGGSVFNSGDTINVNWVVNNKIIDEFPKDFNLGIMLYVKKEGMDEDTNYASLGDGHSVLEKDVEVRLTEMGRYRIVAQFFATPKDFNRMCAISRGGKDCSPSPEDMKFISEANKIKGNTGWFTVESAVNKKDLPQEAVKGGSISGNAPFSVEFNLVKGSANDESINFGDGQRAGTNSIGEWPSDGVVHIYVKPGRYDARVYSSMPSTLLGSYNIIVN